jgi:hypothetical protein
MARDHMTPLATIVPRTVRAACADRLGRFLQFGWDLPHAYKRTE